MCLALPVAGVLAPAISRRLPWLCGWAWHHRQADRYRRGARAARWRLTEARLAPLLGSDLAGLGPLLADPAAEEQCRLLTTWHADRAAAALRRTTRLAAAGCHLLAGAVLLAAVHVPLTEAVQALIEATAGIAAP